MSSAAVCARRSSCSALSSRVSVTPGCPVRAETISARAGSSSTCGRCGRWARRSTRRRTRSSPRRSGAEHTVISDYLEAGTYAIAAAAAGGELVIECTRAEDLELLLLKLEQAGAHVQTGDGWFRVARDRQTPLQPIDMSTWTFPGFPTDLQAQYMALMTQADGESVISEYVHENRFQHVRELAKMGAGITVEGRLHAIVHGPARLRGTDVAIPDIRSGAALVIAALCAEGDSVLRNAWHVERGYEDMVGKLASVGARVKVVRTDSEAAAGHHLYE